jgi:hypothetical protein
VSVPHEDFLVAAEDMVLERDSIVLHPEIEEVDACVQHGPKLGSVIRKVLALLGAEIRPLEWTPGVLHSTMALHRLLQSEGIHNPAAKRDIVNITIGTLAYNAALLLQKRDAHTVPLEEPEEEFDELKRLMELPYKA